MQAMFEKVEPEVCSSLLGLYILTGCDTTNSFVRQGKLGGMKALKKHPEFINVLKRMGNSEVGEEDLKELEKFVCVLYNKPRYIQISAV